MICNFKAMGLTLCVVFAVGALSASAASGATDLFTSASTTGTTYVTGTQIGVGVFGLHSNIGTTQCASGTYTGQYVGTTSTSVELKPSYSGCKIGAGNATVTPNGCKYVLTGTTDLYTNTDGKAEDEDATVSLNCGDEASIAVDGPLGCVITISDTHPAGSKVNQNLLGAKYDSEHEASGKWDVKVTITIDVITFASNSKCASLGFPATATDAFLTKTITLKAYSDAAHTNQVDLTVS